MSGALINISTSRITWLAATNVTSEPLALASASGCQTARRGRQIALQRTDTHPQR